MRTFVAPLLCTSASNAETYHYACTRPNRADGGTLRYAFTVNIKRSGDRGVIKMTQYFPPYASQEFRILGRSMECAKYGWAVGDGGMFCTATKGVASFSWHGLEFDCDQADTR
jgi:hypothetical protein